MRPFDRSDEATMERPPSDRLQAFTKTLWDALVPRSGECASVQGELIRVSERLQSEYLCNGLANYYAPPEPGRTLADNNYGRMLLFMLDTLIENRNHPADADDVGWFTEVRRHVEPDWRLQLRMGELESKREDSVLTDAECEELERLVATGSPIGWDGLFNRAQRCIANWCIANTALIDRQGKTVKERAVTDVRHVFEPPAAPPPCSICKGKGWVPAKDPADFPTLCSCKMGGT